MESMLPSGGPCHGGRSELRGRGSSASLPLANSCTRSTGKRAVPHERTCRPSAAGLETSGDCHARIQRTARTGSRRSSCTRSEQESRWRTDRRIRAAPAKLRASACCACLRDGPPEPWCSWGSSVGDRSSMGSCRRLSIPIQSAVKNIQNGGVHRRRTQVAEAAAARSGRARPASANELWRELAVQNGTLDNDSSVPMELHAGVGVDRP